MVYSYRVKYHFSHGYVSDEALFHRIKDYSGSPYSNFTKGLEFWPPYENIIRIDKVEDGYIYFSKEKSVDGLSDKRYFQIEFMKTVSICLESLESID